MFENNYFVLENSNNNKKKKPRNPDALLKNSNADTREIVKWPGALYALPEDLG